jgi:hypothetical protein
MMADVVREYLRERGYADHVVRDGLGGLVRAWEATVASVARGEEQHQDDYLNDMDGRRILEEALEVATLEQRAKWLPLVQPADDRLRAHLVPTAECIWGEEAVARYGYSRDRDWWYYHRPRNVGGDWRSF